MTGREHGTLVGHVTGIRRYPVKSMQSESLVRVLVGPDGLDGDRRFAVIDSETGRVASAKNPRKWGALLGLRAEWRDGVLVVTVPTGTELQDGRDDLGAELSRLLGRAVTVTGTPPLSAAIEVEWPDVPGLSHAGTESVEALPVGGYVDLAPVHILTTASLRRLRELTPDTDFDPRRFRPNVVVETVPGLSGFVEQDWVGRSLVVGAGRMRVTAPCSRCVMTTLAQPGLAADPRVLRAAAAHNGASVGVYARADHHGQVEEGAPVWLE